MSQSVPMTDTQAEINALWSAITDLEEMRLVLLNKIHQLEREVEDLYSRVNDE